MNTNPELVNLIGTGGLIAALVWAVRYLAARIESLETRLIDVLQSTVTRNTEALLRAEAAIAGCTQRTNGDTKFIVPIRHVPSGSGSYVPQPSSAP